MLDKAKMELGRRDPLIWVGDQPRVTAYSVTELEGRLVAFGLAIDDDRVPYRYEASTNTETDVERAHKITKGWFEAQVASQQEQTAK